MHRDLDVLYSLKLMTNATRIREMSISEMAEFIDAVQSDAYEHGVNETAINDYPNNYGDWADWLREESK